MLEADFSREQKLFARCVQQFPPRRSPWRVVAGVALAAAALAVLALIVANK